MNTSAQGKSLGSTMNSTMNSSNSSGGNYKLQPQPVRMNPQQIPGGTRADIDPLRSLHGSYKNQPAQPQAVVQEKKKGWFGKKK